MFYNDDWTKFCVFKFNYYGVLDLFIRKLQKFMKNFVSIFIGLGSWTLDLHLSDLRILVLNINKCNYCQQNTSEKQTQIGLRQCTHNLRGSFWYPWCFQIVRRWTIVVCKFLVRFAAENDWVTLMISYYYHSTQNLMHIKVNNSNFFLKKFLTDLRGL